MAAAQAENKQLRDQVVDLQTSLDSMKLRAEADAVKSRSNLKVLAKEVKTLRHQLADGQLAQTAYQRNAELQKCASENVL